jgi:hypothetical protein
MRRVAKPMTPMPSIPKDSPGVVAGFDLVELLDKGGEILRREISNLMIESSSKKLSPNSAKDLVAYLKLLHELKEEQQKTLANLSDEELELISGAGHE